MKSLVFFCLLFIPFFSCTVNNSQTDGNTDAKIDSVTAPAPKPEEVKGPAANKDDPSLSKYSSMLQGSWKRQSYPFGTIEFKGEQVKFNEGEGQAAAPAFQPFTIAAHCNSTGSAGEQVGYDFVLKTGDSNCEAVKMDKGTFQIFYGGTEQGVTYKKMDNSTEVVKSFDDFSGRVLPMQPGFYVLAGTNCKTPVNAAWRYWSGVGLSGSATKDCKMKLIKREGNKFTVSQTCTNTYDNSKSTATTTVDVQDVNHFVLTENGKAYRFEFCESAPDWFKY